LQSNLYPSMLARLITTRLPLARPSSAALRSLLLRGPAARLLSSTASPQSASSASPPTASPQSASSTSPQSLTPQILTFTSLVHSGHEAAFERWHDEVPTIAAAVVGDGMMTMRRFASEPDAEHRTFYTNVVICKNADVARRWQASAERAKWFSRGESLQGGAFLVSTTDGPLEGHFLEEWLTATPAAAPAAPHPPKWKMGLTVAAALYPSVTGMSTFVMPALYANAPLLAAQPMALKSALTIALTVPLMTYVGVPIAQKALGPFLIKPPASPQRAVLNVAAVTCLFAALLCGGLVVTGDASKVSDSVSAAAALALTLAPPSRPSSPLGDAC